MKKRLMIIGVTMLFILTSLITSYAATEPTVTLKTDKTEVKAGETFTVTLSATCEEGINSIDTTYAYDTGKLELVSANVSSSNFASLGQDNQITVICNSTESITSADIYVLTFKVKDGVEADSTAKVSVSEIMLDSDAANNSEHTIAAQEVTVTIKAGTAEPEQKPTNPEQKPTDPEQELTDPEQELTNPEQTPGENPLNQNGGEKGDLTVADKDYDKAGINAIIIISIIVISIGAVVIYKKNQSYRDIK